MTLSANIVGRGTVNACGVALDAWHVAATASIVQAQGASQTPHKKVDLIAEYWMGTEYGSFSLQDKITQSGMDGTTNFASQDESTINSAPRTAP